ncbi:MAG TPA: hypothetical protein VEH58_07045, partial [Dehalococcoidales bacterium]|nr:hypothetical protein [Dehalococcoidales bacterium]
ALSSSDTTEGTVTPSSLTFTNSDWATPQTVIVTGVDDNLVDGNVAYSIVTSPAVSLDPAFNNAKASDVSVTNNDNDVVPAGITVNPTSGLVTTESGGTASFSVVLNAKPTADVTIPLFSNNIKEGTVAPSRLIFTSANWSSPQTVTVTGVDDTNVDGNVPYNIVTDPAVSNDPAYNNLNAADVSVTNNDNEAATTTTTANPTTISSPTSTTTTSTTSPTSTTTTKTTTAPTSTTTSTTTTTVTEAPSTLSISSITWILAGVAFLLGFVLTLLIVLNRNRKK